MSKLAEHIKIGRKDAQAGFDFWYDRLNVVTNNGTGGLPAVRALLDEVNEVGKLRTRGRNAGTFKNPQAAFAFYCNKYAHELNPQGTTKAAPKRTTRKVASQAQETQETQETAAPNAGAALLALLQGAGVDLSALGIVTETEDDEDDEDDEDAEIVQGVPVKRVQRNAQTEPETETQTFPPPRDPDAPATQGKLWKLNAEGPENGLYVCVIDGEGNILAGGEDPITAGEAYDLIGEHIA